MTCTRGLEPASRQVMLCRQRLHLQFIYIYYKPAQFFRGLGVTLIVTFSLGTCSLAYNDGCCRFPKRAGLP